MKIRKLFPLKHAGEIDLFNGFNENDEISNLLAEKRKGSTLSSFPLRVLRLQCIYRALD